jgi:hypothetical protein
MASNDKERMADYLQSNRPDTVSEVLETPHGTLYQPRPLGLQILLLAIAFLGGPAVSWAMTQVFQLSTSASWLLYVPLTLVFFLGYALWAARLAAIAFDTIGRGLLWALFKLIVQRKKPEKLEDVLPSRDKLERMVVRAQRAGWSFLVVAIPLGVAAALLSIIIGSDNPAALPVTVCILWGYILGFLARHGYLPLPESDGG